MAEQDTMVIEVRSSDYDKRNRYSQCYCPVALAARRGGWPDPHVYSWGVTYYLYVGNPFRTGARAVELPPVAQRAIRLFDELGAVEEFLFTIATPSDEVRAEIAGLV